MADRDTLLGSLGSLSDTLTLRWDPAGSQGASARWLGVMNHLAAITHRTGALMALPDESADYDPIVAMLDEASRAIVTTGAAGLDQADAALAAVERLFDA